MLDAHRREDAPPSLTPYLVLGFLVLLLALVVRAPASVLQKVLPAVAPVQASAWGGTVWNGQVVIEEAGQGAYWRWQLLPSSLLRGRLGLQLSGQGPLVLHGRIEQGLGGWRASGVGGEVPAGFLQALLPPGWSLPGELRMEAVTLARRGLRQGAWTAAAGALHWGGGPMQFNLGSQPQAATLPALVATLAQDGDSLAIRLAEEAGGGALADVRVGADGGVETRLRERLLRHAGRTSGADLDAVVVTSAQAPH